MPMRRSLETLVTDLSAFIGDDNDGALVLVFDITDHEVPYVLKALETVDGQHAEHVFLHFTHPIDDAQSYMDTLMASVHAQLDAVQSLRAADGLPPWPPLALGCLDPHKSPSERIELLLEYVREQLPRDGGNHIVLGLLPARIGDTQAYVEVIAGLLPNGEPEPWTAGARLLLRDDRNDRFLAPHIQPEHAGGVVFYDGLDFSPDAAIAALIASVHDPETPEDARMMALVQLAALDFSHRRYAESYRKWGVCYEYYTQMKVNSMRVLCVCGAADVLRESGKLAEAQAKYQQGLALFQSQETLPPVLNLLLGLSRACILMEEWSDAEGYLGLADQVASKLCQAHPKCEIMERQGFVYWKQDKYGEARVRWRAAVDLSRELQAWEVAERALEQLIALFGSARMHTERHEHERELEEVRLLHQKEAHA